MNYKQSRGRFQKGADPRRHTFTTEERQKGFWNAVASITARYPEAVNGQTHMVVKFLPAVLRKRGAA